jgi:glycosyltransferase involved in cell wall biosynthesis
MKKVLFITYFWPPSGKASLHWPLKMIKFLPEFGWEPSVLTVNEDTFYQKDETLLKEINSDLQVIKTGTWEPFDIYRKFIGKKKNEPLVASESMSKTNTSFGHRLSLWVRMNLFVPDARAGWYFPGLKEGKKFLSKNKVDIIITNGPPHTTHLLGRKLSSLFNTPHVPIFIDPWVDIVYYKSFKRSKLTLAFDRYLEANVIKKAKENIFVTESMRNDYIKKYPGIENNSHVLYWGYNEDDFSLISEGNWVSSGVETLTHAGNIFDYQNPIVFWQFLKNEINAGRKFKIKFLGTVGPAIKQTINNLGLQNNTEYTGFLSYNDMLKELMKSNYLMVIATEKRHVPGKLFEYLRTGKPILAFGNDNKEVKKILEEANAGMLFKYDEDAHQFFEAVKKERFKTDFSVIKKYDRKNIAGELGQILNRAIE